VKSFSTRIAILFAALVTATTALVLSLGGWSLSRQAIHGLDLLNQAEFAELVSRLGSEDSVLSAVEVDRRIRAHSDVDASMFFFQVQSNSGALLFRSANLGQMILPPITSQHETVALRGAGKVRISTFPIGDLQVQIASPLEPALHLMCDYLRTSLMLLVCVAVASVALGWYFSWLVMRPVCAIRTTASRIRGDNLGERIPVREGRDELAALVGLLNQMFDRLETSFSEVKRFTADASHELKTPLALVRLNIEKLRAKRPHDLETSEVLDSVLEDLDRLRQIIDSLLFLAKLDSGGFTPALTTIEAGSFVQDFSADALALAEDRGAQFQLGRVHAGAVRCEATLVRQLLLNLVSNALRVVPPGGRVTLDSEVQNSWWKLVVADEGPGIPEAQLTRIFERFVRFEPTGGKNENEVGHGLGLAICRSIVQLHGGRIFAENRTDRTGLRVTVELPLK
jgi:signal transduction histidine kinase